MCALQVLLVKINAKVREKMKEYQVKTDVFTMREGEWQVRVGNEVLPTTWNSRGAALAGLAVECKRRGIHDMSVDCWCMPERMSS